jgi:hypothetical protein
MPFCRRPKTGGPLSQYRVISDTTRYGFSHVRVPIVSPDVTGLVVGIARTHRVSSSRKGGPAYLLRCDGTARRNMALYRRREARLCHQSLRRTEITRTSRAAEVFSGGVFMA